MPARMNAAFHPQCCAISGTIAGAATAPTLVPELKMLVASARSLFGNHSATALIADGKFPPSPSPSASRAVKNPRTLPPARARTPPGSTP